MIRLSPSVISLPHWQRLHDGALLAASPYVDWASLLRRTFEIDVLACAHCGGRLRVLAVVVEPEPVRRILEHLGLDANAPPVARARDPTDEFEEAGAGASMGRATRRAARRVMRVEGAWCALEVVRMYAIPPSAERSRGRRR